MALAPAKVLVSCFITASQAHDPCSFINMPSRAMHGRASGLKILIHADVDT
jgi:hypothetical protein